MRIPAALAARVALIAVVVVAATRLLAPIVSHWDTFGYHDWDSHAVYRAVPLLSLLTYHEGPWWNPYLCGGFPSWGYAEGATNLVSPWLPIYLVAPLLTALRLEVVGSTLVALLTSYLLATRLTRSVALRGLVAVMFVFNSRWALQASVGHTWHLQYAWMPLAMYWLHLASEEGQLRKAAWAGGVLALMVYVGGIYPLPHTALAMILYACVAALGQRRLRPFLALGIASATGLGLAAPKLLPVLEVAGRFPRALESGEFIDLGQAFSFLVDSDVALSPSTQGVPTWGWHESGVYVGWVGLAIILAAALFAKGYTARPWRIAGVVLFVLGLGAFLPYSPWNLLHRLPVFSSQHVPTRFLFPAILFLTMAFAAWAARWVDS